MYFLQTRNITIDLPNNAKYFLANVERTGILVFLNFLQNLLKSCFSFIGYYRVLYSKSMYDTLAVALSTPGFDGISVRTNSANIKICNMFICM